MIDFGTFSLKWDVFIKTFPSRFGDLSRSWCRVSMKARDGRLGNLLDTTMLMLMLNLQRLLQHAQKLHEFKPHKIPTQRIINQHISYWKSHIQSKSCLELLPTGRGKVSFFFCCSDIGYVNQTLELTPKLKVLSLSSERDPHIFVHFFVLLSSVYSFVLFLCCCYFLFEREKYVCCVFRAMGRI